MDEFNLEIATANEDLVKLLRKFTNVEQKIDNFDDWSQGLDRLPGGGTEEEELDVTSFLFIALALVALFLPFLFVTAYVLLKKIVLWAICTAAQKMERKESEVKDYAKLEEAKGEKVDHQEQEKVEARGRGRKIAELLGHDLCTVIAFMLVVTVSGQTLEHWGANTGSVQIFIANGDLSLAELGVVTEQSLLDINQEMFSARSVLSTSVEALEKYDPDIQDIILSRIDRVTLKGEMMAERASRLALYLENCYRKKLVMGLSLLYFLCFVGFANFGIRFSVASLGNGLGANLVYFTLGLVSHVILFITMLLVWYEMFVPLLTMFIYSQSYEMFDVFD